MARQIPVEELQANIGKEIAVSDWFEITQDRIDNFADTTEDHQSLSLIHISEPTRPY